MNETGKSSHSWQLQQQHQQLQPTQQKVASQQPNQEDAKISGISPALSHGFFIKPKPALRQSELEEPLQQVQYPEEKRAGLYNAVTGVRGWWAATNRYNRNRPKVNRSEFHSILYHVESNARHATSSIIVSWTIIDDPLASP